MGAFDWVGVLLKLARDWSQNCIPPYQPELWNNPDVQYRNNCYNYACDLQTNTFAQPGRASGHQYTALTCADVSSAAVSDGLSQSEYADCGCSECCHTIALVMAPGLDFHFYRKGPDGKWTHKPGGTPVTNLDNAGREITNPRLAARGPYTQFCGYFCVNKERVHIR